MDKIVEQVVKSRVGLRPLLVGVSGCQGSGKTTLTNKAAQSLNDQGIATIAISIDDFYLPHADQVRLAARGNPLWQKRGLFASHDVDSIIKVLQDLKNGRDTVVPIYDKSQFNGQGDRVGVRRVTGQYKAILIEGWCLGFCSIGKPAIEKALEGPGFPATKLYKLADLAEIDDAMHAYEPIWSALDLTVYLRPEKLDFVYAWRLQQEHDMRSKFGKGMTDDEVKKFVDQYMPAYELYRDTVKFDLSFKLHFDRSFERLD